MNVNSRKDILANHIKKFLPFDCNISIKNKNNHIIHIRKKIFNTDIYIHPVFLKADKNVINDVINFILQKDKKNLNESKKRISFFYEQNKKRNKVRIKDKYKFHDIFYFYREIIENLGKLFININFNKLKITWGKNYKKRRTSIRFGSFDRRNDVIRIHPVLDNQNIPNFFIKSILFHEIGHFIMFSYNKKSMPHNKEFHMLLKKIDPNFEISKRWEKNNKNLFFKI